MDADGLPCSENYDQLTQRMIGRLLLPFVRRRCAESVPRPYLLSCIYHRYHHLRKHFCRRQSPFRASLLTSRSQPTIPLPTRCDPPSSEIICRSTLYHHESRPVYRIRQGPRKWYVKSFPLSSPDFCCFAPLAISEFYSVFDLACCATSSCSKNLRWMRWIDIHVKCEASRRDGAQCDHT